MKSQKIKYAPLALAVSALFAAPLAFADDHRDHGGVHDFKLSAAANLSADVSTTENHTKVVIDKKVKYVQDVEVRGRVNVNGNVNLDSSSAALVDDKQINYLNEVDNDQTRNSAVVDGNAMQSATGNIGLNVTAGDNNQQANSAALASADASFLFGSADAEIFARQDAQSNSVSNRATTNNAALSGSALQNASGNIGVNISAGSNNQQKNDLAASVAVARMATATVAVKQMNDHNSTTNSIKQEDRVTFVPVNLSLGATGRYAGISDQNGNQYLDTWNGASHPGGGSTGHIDLDNSVQGASDRPQPSSLAPNAPRSTGGALSFNEAGQLALSGTVSGFVPVRTQISIATTNTASLNGNALQNARGNIGVNIASGTNNQQYNGLALAVTQAGSRTGGGSE